ncbi:MAG TPA: TonB-dependent receptor [Longimicrobiaceae bacterium]
MRSISGLLVLAVAFAVLVGSEPLGAQQPAVTVRGRIVDERGAPVAGATVHVRGAAEEAAVTDPLGSYELGPLPPGSYRLVVTGAGYRTTERRIEAQASTVQADVVLAAEPLSLAPLQVVAATRTGTAAATLPVKVNVVEQAEVSLQRSLATSPTEILANLIPSFSPPRQKLSSAGESFRGRRPLFLIDGVPQSNPLRDGRRDGFTIDMEAIERVEVIFGANAIQGLGATGGIVNYVTVSPPVTGELMQRASVATTSGDGFDDDGLGWRAHYLAGKRWDRFDLLGSFSYEHRGLQFDGRDRPIGVDNVQGDVANSHSRNFFAKLGWEPTASQRLQLMVNDFRLAQEGEFELVPGDRANGIPATAVAAHPEGVEPINDVTTASLDYEHGDVAGGRLSAKVYVQDFRALFGGGRFDSFQDPRIAPIGELFDQSENNSQKYGARLTYALDHIAGAPVGLISGLDFHRDRTFQRLAHTDRNWVPETTFLNYAPFAQLDLDATSWLSLSGGLRWELAELDVPDYTPLAANRPDYELITVTGGSPGFDEPLFNVGAVVNPIEGLRFYGTLSQAFTMPDVGRVLRAVSEPGTSVESFLALEPIKTDNLEFGGTYGSDRALVGVTYFESEAEMGSRLVPNSDGIFQVMRQPTRTSGWEVTGRVAPSPMLALHGGYSILEGSFDGDGDGSLESDLGAADIGPNRLNLALDLTPGGRLSGRLQTLTFFDRDFRDGAGELTAQFDGYTTVDASLGADLGRSNLTLSVSNLFDEQYITYYGQAATDLADRYFAGRGRTLTLRLETRF